MALTLAMENSSSSQTARPPTQPSVSRPQRIIMVRTSYKELLTYQSVSGNYLRVFKKTTRHRQSGTFIRTDIVIQPDSTLGQNPEDETPEAVHAPTATHIIGTKNEFIIKTFGPEKTHLFSKRTTTYSDGTSKTVMIIKTDPIIDLTGSDHAGPLRRSPRIRRLQKSLARR